MRKRLIGLLTSALIPGLFLLSAPGHAEINQRTDQVCWGWLTGLAQVMGMEKFAEIVGEKSGGKISVKLFPAGSLGGDAQTLSALQGGTVEMTVMNAGLLSGLAKDFAIVDLPFLFDTPQEADAVMDGPVGKALADKLPAKNLIGLGYWELGFRQLTNSRRPVTKVSDIAGLKIRVVQSPIYIDLFNGLGANAVPMPFPEVYTALETKTVDGQENPAPSILTAKLNEVQKYLTLTRHTYNPQIVLVGKRLWDRLNEDERKLIQDATLEAQSYQRAVSREQDGKAVETLKAEGVQVSELPAEEVAQFREKAKPVTEKYSKDIDPALVQQLHDEIAKVRGKK